MSPIQQGRDPRTGAQFSVGALPSHPDIQLTLQQQQPGRADIVLSPDLQSRAQSASGLVGLPPIEESLALLKQLYPIWFFRKANIDRIAIAANTLQAAPDLAAANSLIYARVRALQPDPSINDFMLNVNRPRQSSVNRSLKMNRVSNWNTATLQRSTLNWNPGAPPLAVGIGAPIQVAVCIIEINNQPGGSKIIRHSELPRLIGEMEQMLIEMWQNGDVP